MASFRPSWLLIVLLAVSCTQAIARQHPAEQRSPAAESVPHAFQQHILAHDTLLGRPSVNVAGGTIDPILGIHRTAQRFDVRPSETLSPGQAAASVLAAESPRFGWSAGASELDLQRVDSTAAGVHLLYRQTADGIPVYNRYVRLSLDPQNRPAFLSSDYVPVPTLPDRRARIDAQTARQIAGQAVSSAGARTVSRGLTVYPSDPPKLAWHVIAWPEDVPAEWEVLIDAATGDVVFLIETTLRLHAKQAGGRAAPHPPEPAEEAVTTDGSGLVFDPDPLTTAGVLYGHPFANNDDADVDELNAQRVLVTLRDITQGGDGLYRLEGPHVKVVGRNAANREVYSPPAEAHPDSFRYTRSNDFFEAVNVYHHIDASQRHVQSLGFLNVQNGPIEANPHGEGGRDQSFFYPNQNFLSYGTGNVDDAEDADVILHEYGHALLEATSPGMSLSQAGSAIHEGWADYWAGSHRRHLVESASVPEHDWRRLFRWDSGYTGEGAPDWTYWPGRVLNHAGRYPEDLVGNKWTDGLLLATALMQIYDETGRQKSDALNLQAQFFLSSGSTMPDYARALIEADRLLHQNQYTSALINILADRGFIDRGLYGPVIAHAPPEGVHQPGTTVRIEAGAASLAADVVDVHLHYRVSDRWQAPVPMTQENDTLFAVDWTLPQTDRSIAYYLSARDRAGLTATAPRDAPDEVFQIGVGVDLVPPEIALAPVERASIAGWPAEVSALVTDDSGVDSVWVEYSLLRDGAETGSGAFGLMRDEPFFFGAFDLPASVLAPGDRIAYRIHARDNAGPPNTGSLPDSAASPLVLLIDDSEVLRHFSFDGPARGVAGTGQWQRGRPAFGITAPYSGAAAWGTILGEPYGPDGSVSTLLLPPLDLSRFDSAHLVFFHWYDTPEEGARARDGGNVRISVDGGQEWALAAPAAGYPALISAGAGNPMAGEPAFAGKSPNWRRAAIPLPAESDVQVRFDFGTGTGAGAAQSAGWFIDEAMIVEALDPDPQPPRFEHLPPGVLVVEPGTPPPPVSVRVDGGAGVDRVTGRFDLLSRDGSLVRSDSLRFLMDAGDPRHYQAVLAVDSSKLSVGSRIRYRISARGFDGAVAEAPQPGASPFEIEYRRSGRHDLLAHAVRTGHWSAGAGYWHIGAGVHEPSASSLIPAPVDLPENLSDALLRVEHRFEMQNGIGGNLKISADEGASWNLLEPAEGYSSTIRGNGFEEPVFGGDSGTDVQASYFDLLPYAGRQIRLRVDFRATRPLDSGEFWEIRTAEAAYSTLDDEFETPRQTALHANFPNPFSHTTTFTYTLAAPGRAVITVFDAMGREIATLLNEERMEGTHSLSFDGTNLANGVYLVRFQVNGQTHVRKITVIR